MSVTLSCPLCQSGLTDSGGALVCPRGHHFDQARQGYWNLLPVQHKRSRNPGDNAAMVSARRRFLEGGFYQPLADAVCHMAQRCLADHPRPQVLDIGCGEGYYTAQLASALRPLQPDVIGLDIAKPAIKAACQRDRSIHWLVASGAHPPVPPASQDLVVVMFSRLMPDALARCIRPGGYLLLAWPGEQHLLALRRQIYAQVRASRFDPISQLQPAFGCQQITPVRFTLSLADTDAITALLQMTPHGQRLTTERREQVLQSTPLSLEVDVNIALLQKQAG